MSDTFMNQKFDLDITSMDDTGRLAALLARHLQPGQFLGLCGDLGAGKTTLTRRLTEELGCGKLATSPTFSLIQEYPGGRLAVCHADLYRLGSEDELYDLGWEESLEQFAAGLVVVEWADKFPRALPHDRLLLTWHHGEAEEHRRLEFRAQGTKSVQLCERLKEGWKSGD